MPGSIPPLVSWRAALGAVGFVALLFAGGLRVAASAHPGDAGLAERMAVARGGGNFRVLAVDEHGEPVAGAEVYVVQMLFDGPDDDEPARTTAGPFKAGADGVAQVTDLPSNDVGFEQFLYTRLPGRKVGGRQRSFSVRFESPVPQDPFAVPMGDSMDLRGSVTVPRGSRPQDVTVRLLGFISSADDGPTFRYSRFKRDVFPELFERRPNADGSFVLPDVPAGGHRYVAANGPGLGEAQWSNVRSARAGGDGPPEPRFEMRPEGVIQGTVTCEGDAKVPQGLTVAAQIIEGMPVHRMYQGAVDEGGRFRIGGLPAGAFTTQLTEFPEGWTVATLPDVRVEAGRVTDDLVVRLERGAVISGTVVDRVSGKPLAGAGIATLNPPHGRQIGHTRSGPDGSFRVRVPAGRSQIYIMSAPTGFAHLPDDDPQANGVPVDAATGEDQAGVVLHLRPDPDAPTDGGL